MVGGGGGGWAPPGFSFGSATAKSSENWFSNQLKLTSDRAFLGFFHTTPIPFAAGTKTRPDRASVQA